MIKVMIADDEEKVCRLIYKLIDWEALGMQVVSIVYDGIEALEQIEAFNPDIVITDIRMPGYDGLELIQRAKEANGSVGFIIISGYRQFDYAQSAIKYGVNDYLLKPVKKEALEQTLRKMGEKYHQQDEKISREKEMETLLKRSVKKVWSSIFTDILMQEPEETEREISIEDINREYQYQFEPGCFQVFIVKIDHNGNLNKSSMDYLEKKILDAVGKTLRDFCVDLECYCITGAEYCLLNYEKESIKTIRKQIKAMQEEIVLQEMLFEEVKFTIGLGIPVEEVKELHQSAKTAESAIEQRLLTGAGKIIEGKITEVQNIMENLIFFELNRLLAEAFDHMDEEKAKAAVLSFRRSLLDQPDLTGHDVLLASEEVCNIFMACMRNNQIAVNSVYTLINQFRQQIPDFSSVEKLFSSLAKTIGQGLRMISEDKKQELIRPIREAKLYIQENYMKPITIEEVSSIVGFSPTYFSSLFKKETGSTFLEYVSNIKMTKAKELLKKTNQSVAVICEQVGYSDIKYFTKTFKKYTGLKPNEYRKLYS